MTRLEALRALLAQPDPDDVHRGVVVKYGDADRAKLGLPPIRRATRPEVVWTRSRAAKVGESA